MNKIDPLICCLLFFALYSCSPKLNISEIEQKINDYNKESSEGNIEYIISNTPKKYLKEFGESGFRKKLTKIYEDNTDPIIYSEILDIDIQERNKCNSFYYYKVSYKVTKSQMTPFLDSTALLLNQNEYGKENVTFNSNSKILHITEVRKKILIFDKDRNWKILNLDKESLDKYYQVGFSKCANISNEE